MTSRRRTRRTHVGALTLAALSSSPLTTRAQTAPPPANDAPPTVTVVSAPTRETLAPADSPALAPAAPSASAPVPPPPAYPPARFYPPPPAYPPPPGYAPPSGYPLSPSWQRAPYGAGYQSLPATPPGYETHDGFYLRLHLGGGFTSIVGSNGARLSGKGVSLGVALGGAITQHLIIFGTVSGTIISNPTVKVTETGLQTDLNNLTGGSASVGGAGAGLAYYVEPVNAYVSGALMLVTFEFDGANNQAIFQSDTGLGFQGIIGKEWWVSTNWGLGVAGELIVGKMMKDKSDPNYNWTSSAFSVLFSATYN